MGIVQGFLLDFQEFPPGPVPESRLRERIPFSKQGSAILRIIAHRESTMDWQAWWNDLPHAYQVSGSAMEAVPKLLENSSRRGVAMDDLAIEQSLSRQWHVEWTVLKQGEKPD